MRHKAEQHEAELKHQEAKYEAEMKARRQELNHREQLWKLEIEQLINNMVRQETAFQAKLERIQNAHISELLEKDKNLDMTQGYYKKMIADFQQRHDEEFESKEDEARQLKEAVRAKDNQLKGRHNILILISNFPTLQNLYLRYQQ